MATRYSHSALLSMRNWWKKQPWNIKPMVPTDWNACKVTGILKHTRGKRGGSCNQMTNSIQVLDSRRRQIIIPVAKSTRNQSLELIKYSNWHLAFFINTRSQCDKYVLPWEAAFYWWNNFKQWSFWSPKKKHIKYSNSCGDIRALSYLTT